MKKNVKHNNDITSNNMYHFIQEAKCILKASFESAFINKNIKFENIYPIKIENYHKPRINKNILEQLSYLYEELIPLKTRKDYGQFYTNDEDIISFMCDSINLFGIKILEPSCGSGRFLVAIVNRVVQIMKKKKYNNVQILEYIRENIFGNDYDEIALQISEINILACIMPLVIDAVKQNNNFKLKKFNLIKSDFVFDDYIKDRYDLIIGNPPFVTMYGKRSRNMNEDKRAYFNTFDFVVNKEGNNKFNLSMFFVENGLKHLNPGGRLLYIMDISFLETAFNDLRRYIVKNYMINSLTTGIKAFDSVASGQVIIDISNTDKKNKSLKIIDYSNNKEIVIDQSIWDDDKKKYKYFVPLNDIDETIINKIKQFKRLDYYFPNKSLRTCCALTGKTDEFIVDPNKEKKHLVLPYLEGSKGLKEKFGHLTNSRFIKYDYELQLKLSDEFKVELEEKNVKNKKRVTLGDRDAYLLPKVFIRQSAKEIIASYTDEPFAANNSLYILTLKKNDYTSIKKLKYACGILNSDLVSYYCQLTKIIRYEKGKTPQIKISDLKDIRISFDDDYYEKIIEIVDALLLDPNNRNLIDNLNSFVYKMYDINDKEMKHISEKINEYITQ